MQTPRIGVYPGTFDPVTFGHLDVMQRALEVVDTLIIGVARHSSKNTLFSVEERLSMVHNYLKEQGIPEERCRAVPIQGLLIDCAREHQATLIIRGLRAVSDFEYEFQMAMMNTRLAPDLETVFLMASERHQFIASKLVREVARLQGDINSFVPAGVAQALRQRFSP